MRPNRRTSWRSLHLARRLANPPGSSARNLRNDPNAPPCVGDWITFSAPNGTAVIERILDRRTLIERKRPGTAVSSQALAANVDRVVIVMSLDNDFSLQRLERYLTLVWESGATPLIALTKADLASDIGFHQAEVGKRALGFPVFVLRLDDDTGLRQLERDLRPQQTIVMLGSSGAGKSTLINRLAGSELRATASVRECDSTGRHTTTDRQLLRLPSGVLVIDTPGLREVQLWAESSSLEHTFTEISDFARQCQFRDCSHQHEPECAVQAAVIRGDIDQARYNNYIKLRTEIAYLNRQTDVAASQLHKSKMKQLGRLQNQMYRISRKR